MTLPLNSRLSALYETNGTQKDFGFGFRVFFDPDNGGYGLEVRRQIADGYEVIPKSDYLVLPVEDNSAGIVRFSVAPPAGQQIYIAGKTPTIQQLVLTNFGRYSAESIETQFDFITAIIQEWLSALGEETRQRIAADAILTQYVIQRIDDFVQQVNQNFDDKSQEIEDYIATIMPSFTQALRDEIEAYAVAGMQDAIDATLAGAKSEIDSAVARATAAADAAAIAGKVYDTPEAGVDPVTGVDDGAYFNVRSSSDESYIDEYQNIAGVPTSTGKSFPSAAVVVEAAAAAAEVKEAIIDPVTGQASTLKIFAPSGESQDEINTETQTQLTKASKQLARTVWVDDYGDVGSGQEASAAFQAAVNGAGVGGTVLFDGKGEYILSVPTNILDKQEINGNGALLINNFDRVAYPRGVLQGLMQYGYNSSGAGTNIVSLGTTTAAINHLESVLSIASTANVNVGDMVNFGMLSAFVLEKTLTTLTLDRFATYNVPAGTAVYKVNFFSGIRIHDFEIDFNGTTELPRYGYGVIGHGAYDCHAYNFKSRNIGSKVVQYGRAIDCTAKNIPHFFGTDNAADGGHGYVVRFAGGCDSCVAENVEGILVRHTVDLAGASRCVVKNNKAIKNHSASFLTHSLNTHYNQFKDNDSYDSNSAYQVVEGDTYNSVSGGKVVGRMFIGDANLDQTTEWKNLNITNSHALSQLNDFTLSNSIINCLDGQTAALFRFTDNRARVVTLNDCTININSAITNCLMSSSGTGAIRFVLNRCTLNVDRIAQFVLMAANDTIEFNDCTLVAADTTENLPLISSTGKIIVNGGNFGFKNSGLVFFGVTNTSTTLSLNGVTFKNAAGIWRRYQTGSKVLLGQNTLTNSTYAAFSNTNLGTIGVANNLAYPPAGTWDIGSRIVNPAPAAGGYAEYIMVTGGWKGASAIQA